jgi:surfeit locus 1 family protein
LLKKLAGGLIVLVCFCCLVGLGLWQLQRLDWKERLLAQLAEGLAKPAAAWSNGDSFPEFTHVTLTGGTLQQSPALKLYGRTVDGIGGVHVLALYRPLSGKPILVDRGFLPMPVDEDRVALPGNGDIDGIVRAPSDKAWFEFANKPDVNQWYWIDLPAMAKALGADSLAPIYVEALKPTAAENAPLPTGDRLASNLPNNHLQYAITWFSLACALALMYAIWLLRSTRRNSPSRQP